MPNVLIEYFYRYEEIRFGSNSLGGFSFGRLFRVNPAVIDRLYDNINKFYRLLLGNPDVTLLSLQYQNKRIITIKINKIMEAKEKVLATMKEAGTPLNAGKIAELSGLDKKEVEKAMKQLKEEGAIVSPVRCKWAPAE